MIARVLENMGATVWSWGMMYKAMFQLVFLYNSERWVVTGDMLNILEGFHHRAARRITRMTATRAAGGEWECPVVVTAMESKGLHTIREYIRRRQGTIAEKLACRHIYEL